MSTILAIDDDRNILNLIKKQMEMTGYTVLISTNGKDGVEMAKSGTPDLVILDIMMPGIDGFSVLHKLKNDPLTKITPIIMLTSSQKKENVVNAMRYGVADYIVKPYSYFTLQKKIEAAIKYGHISRVHNDENKEKHINIIREPEKVILSIMSPFSDPAFIGELKNTLNQTFVNVLKKTIVVLDLRGVPEFGEADVKHLENLIALLGTSNLHIVAGKHYGVIVEHGNLEERFNLYITFGDFEVYISQE